MKTPAPVAPAAGLNGWTVAGYGVRHGRQAGRAKLKSVFWHADSMVVLGSGSIKDDANGFGKLEYGDGGSARRLD